MTHLTGPRTMPRTLLLITALFALSSGASTAVAAPASGDDDPLAIRAAPSSLDELPALADGGRRWAPAHPYRIKTPRRGSASGGRFHASLGGGLAIGSLWMDYTVDSRYQVEKNGLVQDEEIRQYYFLAQPELDIEVGAELARDHLVLAFHVALMGMMQRVSATMVAEWEGDRESVIDKIDERRYTMALVNLGVGAHYVFLPDKVFTPLIGLRFGMGITWDADFHMIDAWKHWYKKEEADIERGLYIRYRVPIRGGLDLGARIHLNDSLAIAIHVPAELFFTHGYLRGAILGVNARLVLRL